MRQGPGMSRRKQSRPQHILNENVSRPFGSSTSVDSRCENTNISCQIIEYNNQNQISVEDAQNNNSLPEIARNKNLYPILPYTYPSSSRLYPSSPRRSPDSTSQTSPLQAGRSDCTSTTKHHDQPLDLVMYHPDQPGQGHLNNSKQSYLTKTANECLINTTHNQSVQVENKFGNIKPITGENYIRHSQLLWNNGIAPCESFTTGLLNYSPSNHHLQDLPRNTCGFCGAVKQGPAALERHLRKHTGIKPFVCEICNKAFKVKRSLQYHQYTNHGLEHINTNIIEKHCDAHKLKVADSDRGKEDCHSVSKLVTTNDVPGTGMDVAKSPLTGSLSTYGSHDGVMPLPPSGQTTALLLGKEVSQNAVSLGREPLYNEGNKPKHESMDTDNSSIHSSPGGEDCTSGEEGELRQSYNHNTDGEKHSYQRKSVISENFSNPADSTSQNILCDNNGNVQQLHPCEETEDQGSNPKLLYTSLQGGKASTRVTRSSPISPPEKFQLSEQERLELSQVTECPYCRKCFPKPSDMKRHLMVHTGEKPFRCHLCGQGFKAKGSMQYHLKAAHSIDIELSPGLEERYLRSRVNADQRRLDRLRHRMERRHWSAEDSQDADGEQDELVPPISKSLEPVDSGFMETPAAIDYSRQSETSVSGNVKENVDRFSSTMPELVHIGSSSREQEGSNLPVNDEMDQYQSSFNWSSEEKTKLPQSDQAEMNVDNSKLGRSGSSESLEKKSPDTLNNNRPERSQAKDYDGSFKSLPVHETDDSPLLSKAPPQILDHNANVDSQEEEELTVDYPSNFPGLRRKFRIKNESVLVSKMEGTNIANGDPVTLYKCYICSKVFNFLSRLQCHLSLHYERQISLYQCSKCGASFKFRVQLRRHLRLHKGAPYAHRPRSLSESLGLYPEQFSSVESVEPATRVTQMEQAELGYRLHKNPPEHSQLESDNGKQLESKPVLHLRPEYDAAYESPATITNQDDSVSMRSERSEQESIGERDVGSELYGSLGGAVDLLHSEQDNLGQYLNTPKYMYQKFNGMYICRYCNKCFDRFFSLQRHERVHTGFKPCYCHECGKGFSEPRNLRHHIVRYHANSPQLNMVKRVRTSRSLSSGLSRSSQRLTPVTPDMIALANQEPSSRESKLERLLVKDDPKTALTETPMGKYMPDKMPVNRDGNEKESRSDIGTPYGEPTVLAEEIREKERLDEDVTVVIPSDAPLLAGEPSGEIPGSNISNVSDNTSWAGENVSEGESDSSHSNEIVSAPWHRSIMAYKQQMRAKRKGSLPQRLSSPSGGAVSSPLGGSGEVERTLTATISSEQEQSSHQLDTSPLDIKPVMSLAHPSQSVTSVAMAMPFSPMLPVTSTAGLLAMPPHLYLGASPAFHPSLIPPYLTPPSLLPPQGIKMEPLTMGLPQSSTGGWLPETTSPEASGGLLSTSPTSLSSYSRSSSLSRSHSRLNVVRTPVRREDACKPTLLPDGRTVYRCTYCSKDFGSFSDINRHMDFHEDIRPYKCKFCDYYARTNSQLKVHMMRHQGIREFHCKLCNYKGVTQSDLNRHMKSQIHMMKAQNECRLCGEGFVSPKNLEKHLAHCQGRKPSDLLKSE